MVSTVGGGEALVVGTEDDELELKDELLELLGALL
jgi:hypothetical protein